MLFLLPVLGGAVQEGRLGTVGAAVVLPWTARNAARFDALARGYLLET